MARVTTRLSSTMRIAGVWGCAACKNCPFTTVRLPNNLRLHRPPLAGERSKYRPAELPRQRAFRSIGTFESDGCNVRSQNCENSIDPYLFFAIDGRGDTSRLRDGAIAGA